jgi:hypothetical protein
LGKHSYSVAARLFELELMQASSLCSGHVPQALPKRPLDSAFSGLLREADFLNPA